MSTPRTTSPLPASLPQSASLSVSLILRNCSGNDTWALFATAYTTSGIRDFILLLIGFGVKLHVPHLDNFHQHTSSFVFSNTSYELWDKDHPELFSREICGTPCIKYTNYSETGDFCQERRRNQTSSPLPKRETTSIRQTDGAHVSIHCPSRGRKDGLCWGFRAQQEKRLCMCRCGVESCRQSGTLLAAIPR